MKIIALLLCLLIGPHAAAQVVTYLTPAQQSADVAPSQAPAISRVRAWRGVLSANWARVDPAQLVDGPVQITLPDGTYAQYTGKRGPRTDDDFDWSGTSTGRGRAGLSVHGRGVTGTLVTDSGRRLRLITLAPRLQILVEYDPAATRAPADDTPTRVGSADVAPRTTHDETGAVLEETPVVRILFVTTPDGLIAPSEPPAWINYINQTFRNSGVTFSVTAAGVYQLPYEFFGDPPSVVNTLPYNLDLQQLHDQYSADLTVVVYDDPNYHGTVVGAAYAISSIESTSDAAVLSVASDLPRTIAHEIGHLFGNRHQRSGGDPPSSDDPSDTPFPQGHGYWYCVGYGTAFHTIMSSYSKCSEQNAVADIEIDNWSNPNIVWDGLFTFIPTGTSSNYEASVLNSRAARVSTFHLTLLDPPPDPNPGPPDPYPPEPPVPGKPELPGASVSQMIWLVLGP